MKLLSIQEALNTYSHLHDHEPSFGMSVGSEDFIPNKFVILENNGKKSEGIPVRFDFYVLLLCIKSGSIRNVNQFEYEIKKNSLQLIPPGTIHHFKDTHDNPHSYVLLFEKEFIENLELLGFHNTNFDSIILDETTFKKVKDLYESINDEAKNSETNYLDYVNSLLLQILIILKRQKQEIKFEKTVSRGDFICNRYLALIEIHIYEYKSVVDYARLMQLSSKHLSETVKEKLGNTALYYIHERLLKEAKYLLVYTEQTVYNIATSLNFLDASQFTRFFKSKIGITPKDFRSNYKL